MEDETVEKKDDATSTSNDDGKLFDSVFKTLVRKHPYLLIPIINVAFSRNIPLNAPVVRLASEHQQDNGSRYDDGTIRIGDHIYHIECQSQSDKTIVARMLEYDFDIAIDRLFELIGQGDKGPFEIDFPSSCVLFINNPSKDTPDYYSVKVNLPEGGHFMYKTMVIKAQSFTIDDYFDRHLLFLVPFHPMRYSENALKRMVKTNQTAQLINMYLELNRRLGAATLAQGNERLYDDIVELICRIMDRTMSGQEELKKEAIEAMSGDVLELLTDRIDSAKRKLDSTERKLDSTERKLDSTERKLDSTERKLEEERRNARKKDERTKAAIESRIESIRSSGLDEDEARKQIMLLEDLYSAICSDSVDDAVGDHAMAL